MVVVLRQSKKFAFFLHIQKFVGKLFLVSKSIKKTLRPSKGMSELIKG